jgi:cell division protein FtsA
MSENGFIVGLDVGTTKIFTVVAKLTVGGELKVLGAGSSRTRGVKRGVVISIHELGEAIGQSISEAELSAGVSIREVFAGVSGEHIESHNVQDSLVIARAGEEVTQKDVRKVIKGARTKLERAERQILHVSPQQFVLDNQKGIVDPVGMKGIHLEVELHVVTGAAQNSSHLLKSMQEAGVKVKELVLEPVAERYSLLSEEEGEAGAILVDIGGSLTNVAVFAGGGIRHSFVLPVGGVHVIQDIAIGLRTSTDIAEMVMGKYGTCAPERIEPGEMFFLPDQGGMRKEVERERLCAIIQARVEEIFELVLTNLERQCKFANITAGVVLSGGGSMLDGVDVLAERVLHMPVRIGSPTGIVGLSHSFSDSRFATGIGLVLYAVRNAAREPALAGNGRGLFWGIMGGKVRSFFSDFI